MEVVVFPNHHTRLLERLNQMRLDGRYCDIRFRIGQITLPAHRVVLAAQSQVLRDLFNINILQCEEEIIMDNVDIQVLQQALNFIYLGHVSITKVPAA